MALENFSKNYPRMSTAIATVLVIGVIWFFADLRHQVVNRLRNLETKAEDIDKRLTRLEMQLEAKFSELEWRITRLESER
jgi:flagellar capping protein FliD